MLCIFSHKTVRNLTASLIVFSLCSTITFSQPLPDKNKPSDRLIFQARTLINLLDYVSQDYTKAVDNGKVINNNEYSEMIDFTSEAITLFSSISNQIQATNKQGISKQLSELLIYIKRKEDKNLIATSAQQIKKQIFSYHLIDVYPEQYPDISKGKTLFLTNCQSCHGATGAADGTLSKTFTPPPANFQDDSLMQLISPLQVFNTARLGIKGTGMRAFDELPDNELWEIAFYIKSLRFEKENSQNKDSLEKIFKSIQPSVSLSDVAHLSDKELQEKFPGSIKEKGIAALRLHQPDKGAASSLSLSTAYLDEAFEFYENGNSTLAEEKALYAYLDGIEPLEQQLTAIDANIVQELETKMNNVRTAIKTKQSPGEVNQEIDDAKISIAKASQLLGEQTYSFWFSFFVSASILLREGLEAVLIIITILSLLQSLKAKQAIKWVHGGWIAAVFIGFASWFFTGWLISFGSQNRELMEAFGAVIAVVILLYVGFWLHKKTEAKKWQQFVEEKIVRMLNQEKLFGLAFISFIVVFREAFESILFLSSLQMQTDKDSRNGIWLGVLSAIAAVILLAHLLLRFTIKLPIRKLFQYSSVIIVVFAIALAGQGAHAFQEAGWLSVKSIPLNYHSEILGIFPTVQTYTVQIIAIIATIIIWRRSRKLLTVKS